MAVSNGLQITQACVTSVSYNWWVREGFFGVGSGLKESGILVDNGQYFRQRRVEGCDKGCSVSLGRFFYLWLKGSNAIRISL